jgi:hypothetical protein
MRHTLLLVFALLACCGLASCKDIDKAATDTEMTPSRDVPAVSVKPESKYDGTIAKPGSPFSLRYKVIGTPIVGSPVTVDLRVTSKLGPEPLKISYRINDASAMMFHEAQPSEIKMAPAANEDFIAQQVTVIPQREGRLYLNVGASVETDSGSMSSMMAIPKNGELQLDENGEAVRVLTVE